MLTQQIQLQGTLDFLLRSVRHGDYSQLETGLLQAKEDADGINNYFRSTLKPVWYNERRSKDSNIAQRVFHTPELLELILVELGFYDLVR